MEARVLFFLCFVLPLVFLEVSSTGATQPHELKSFKVKTIQRARTCSYAVRIRTSCSSVSFTRDRVSLAFGDAYGNEVYVPRLDDPSSGTFERCSTDTFTISGPCTYQICYLYLLRSGSDGWMPEQVIVYPPNSRGITFTYNRFLPNGVWYGFDFCNGGATHFDADRKSLSHI